MKRIQLSTNEWVERITLAFVFLAVGSLVILVFSPWRPLLVNRVADYLGRIGLAVVLLVALLFTYIKPCLEKYRQILIGLFILAVTVSLDLIFGRYIIESLGVSAKTPSDWALIKLNEGFVVISVIIVLNKVIDGSLGSIFIQKGNLKLGLIVGLVTFFLAAAGSIPMATLFKARDLSFVRVLPWIPWLLIYVLANASLEELMFRGLFLRKLQPFFGKFLANFLIALVFTGLHGTVTYSADNMIFLAVTFPLALAWGYLMQKTGSVWGSILFHAGMDIPIMVGIFSNL
jgi:membrane protease YdiL (CAAX protease family)